MALAMPAESWAASLVLAVLANSASHIRISASQRGLVFVNIDLIIQAKADAGVCGGIGANPFVKPHVNGYHATVDRDTVLAFNRRDRARRGPCHLTWDQACRPLSGQLRVDLTAATPARRATTLKACLGQKIAVGA